MRCSRAALKQTAKDVYSCENIFTIYVNGYAFYTHIRVLLPEIIEKAKIFRKIIRFLVDKNIVSDYNKVDSMGGDVTESIGVLNKTFRK